MTENFISVTGNDHRELTRMQLFEGGNSSNDEPPKKKLKVACVAVSAMGHFIPMQNCATALKEARHDVYIITNGNDNIKEKT